MRLASKCQYTIALAIALMIASAAWILMARLNELAEDQPRRRAQDLAQAMIDGQLGGAGVLDGAPFALPAAAKESSIQITLLQRGQFESAAENDPFLTQAIERFTLRRDAKDAFIKASDAEGNPYYRYARAIRLGDAERSPSAHGTGPRGTPRQTEAPPAAPPVSVTAAPLEMVLLVQLRDEEADRRAALNAIYLGAAGLSAALVGALAFWLIVTRIVLTPIRLLTGYAERVYQGESNLRAEIHTGDEFQKLAEMFNDMLDRARKNEAELRSLNKGLDLRLGELAESNVALYEANKVKGEFLANVSHELRTPLNSIAGFAEVLRDTLDGSDPVDEKRRRYAQNIITSSKQLLELINDLLDLAKIEAGRLELRVGPVSLADTCEGLVTLIRPMAEKRRVRLRLKVAPNLPLVETDAGRLQQILFNFLSNAVKFTPAEGVVTLQASRVESTTTTPGSVRISVSDTGPGIDPADHQRIFEKFTQIDASATRAQGGTGLGLTICRDLSDLLGGTIDVESAKGHGATFILTIPLSIKARSVPLMPEG